MTLRATFVVLCHGQPAGRLENIAAVRVVALNATHAAFNDGMMLRQIEFGVDIEMTLKTRRRIVVRIDDEIRAAAGFNVFAAGGRGWIRNRFGRPSPHFKMNARVRAGGKFSRTMGAWQSAQTLLPT